MDTATLSAATALAAVIIGPIITWMVTKKQISAQVVSTNRQAWINDLRNILAEFIRDARSLSSGYSTRTISKEEAFSRFEKMLFTIQKIKLMLNPDETDHQELLHLMNSLIGHVNQTLSDISIKEKVTNDEERIIVIEAITPIAQKILKSEWIRVKAGN